MHLCSTNKSKSTFLVTTGGFYEYWDNIGKMTSIEDDDVPHLPADTMAILQAFIKEKEDREQVELAGGKDVNFEEDWQLSQFWYSAKTKSDLTKVCQHLRTNDDAYTIGLLSCPSLYASIKDAHDNVKIFEYDQRFAAYGDDFVFYDFNDADHPECLQSYENYFDLVIVDPPFLSEECMEKISKIVKKVVKKDSGKIIFCSGEVCESWIKRFLGLNKCQFKPEHERNLGNEFVSYSNFNLDEIVTNMKS